MRRTISLFVWIFVLAGLAMPAAADDAPALKPLVFLPQWRPQAQFAGYYTALYQGFYRKHGLEVTILKGGPERSPTAYLAEGKADMATQWLSTALQLADRGVPVVNVAQIVQRSALVLAVKRSSGIGSPADMNGKKLAVWPADFQIQPLAFIDQHGLDVRIVTTASPIQLFLRDGVQIASLMWYNEYHTLLNAGLDPEEMRLFFFEDDLNFPEDGIYLRADDYAADPGSARAFAAASLEGWQYAFDHPAETVDMMIAVMEAAHVPANRVHQRWMLARMRDVMQPREAPMGMLRRRGIAFRLGAAVLLGAAVVFAAVATSGYLHSRDTIVKHVEQNAQNLARATVQRIQAVLAPVEKVPANLALLLETLPLDEDRIVNLLRNTLAANPDIFGMAVAFEPSGFDPARLYFSPYVSRLGPELHLTYLGGDAYDYFTHDWYQVPRETGRPGWSEPYFDQGGGNALMTTYTCPFSKTDERGQRQFAGVVTADVTLAWLERIVAEMRILQSGYGFILAGDGTFIVHPDRRWQMNETIFSIAEARGDRDLRRIGRRMIRGESGLVPFSGDPRLRPGMLCFAPIGHSRWSLGIFFPQDELMADLTDFTHQSLYLSAAGLVLLILVVALVARTITRPLTALAAAAREMATGKLAVAVPGLRSGGEVGVLARSLDHMQSALSRHIRQLLETTAAKERIEGELNVAREIQMGLLPKMFPPFPDIPGLDLHALIAPAREVGGDLYDFYRLDDRRIGFILGDVSGKGVPAALFMAVTMTLMKMTAAKGLTPDRILKEVNDQLSRDNDATMFVTLFCGILDIHSGELQYANGGHNPPVLLRNGAPPEFLEGTGGMLLGAMEAVDYAMKRIVLQPGEGIFIYSDGVTEAQDAQDGFYSEERLLDLLDRIERRPAARVIEAVMGSVNDFAGDTPQADDITMMMVRLKSRTTGDESSK